MENNVTVGAFHQRERIFIIAYPHRNGKSDVSLNEGERQGVVDEISNPNDERQKRSREDEIRHKEFSNSSSFRCNNRSDNREERQIQSTGERGNEEDKSKRNGREYRSGEVCEVLSDSERIRPSEQGEPRRPLHSEKEGYGEASRFDDDSIWRAEPGLGRVADGIPNRVDRIKCLGNAVVPQCAEVFARAIKMKLSSQNLKNQKIKHSPQQSANGLQTVANSGMDSSVELPGTISSDTHNLNKENQNV